MKLTINQKRFGLAIVGLPLLLAWTNNFLGWNLFGQFDKLAILLSALLIFLYLRFVGPSIKEIYDHRVHQSQQRGTEYKIRLWTYLLPLLIIMIVMIFVGDGAGLLTGEVVPRDHWIVVIFVELLLIVGGIIGWRRLKGLLNDSNRE